MRSGLPGPPSATSRATTWRDRPPVSARRLQATICSSAGRSGSPAANSSRAPHRGPTRTRSVPRPRQRPNLQGWLLGVPYWPLDRLFGTVWAYNLIVLLSVVSRRALRLLVAPRARGRPWRRPRRRARVRPRALPGRAVDGHLLGLIAFLLPAMLLALERRRLVWAAIAARRRSRSRARSTSRWVRSLRRSGVCLGAGAATRLVEGGPRGRRRCGVAVARPAARRRRLDRGRRAVVRPGTALLRRAVGFLHARRRRRHRGARLRRLADAPAGAGRALGRPAPARARMVARPLGAAPVRCSRSGANLPLYEPLWRACRRFASPACRSA